MRLNRGGVGYEARELSHADALPTRCHPKARHAFDVFPVRRAHLPTDGVSIAPEARSHGAPCTLIC